MKNKINKNKINIMLGAIVMIMVLAVCSKTQDNSAPYLNSTELAKNIVNDDIEALRKQIDSYFSRLTPKPIEEDRCGNKERFDRFVADLEQCADISIIHSCYGCVYTLPPISEIKVKTIYQNRESERVIDLILLEKEILKFLTLHE